MPDGKQVSHKIIAGNIAGNVDYLSLYLNSELQLLLHAYNVPFKKSFKKEQLMNALKEKVMDSSVRMMANPSVLAPTVPSPAVQVSNNDCSRGQKRPHYATE